MIDSVAGAMVRPMPAPNTSRMRPPMATEDINVSLPYSTRVAATIAKPITTTFLVPIRSASLGALGAMTMIPTATGAVISPALNGE